VLNSNRKRVPDVSPSANDVKRTKIVKPVARKINKIVIPVIEYEQPVPPSFVTPSAAPDHPGVPLAAHEAPVMITDDLEKVKEVSSLNQQK